MPTLADLPDYAPAFRPDRMRSQVVELAYLPPTPERGVWHRCELFEAAGTGYEVILSGPAHIPMPMDAAVQFMAISPGSFRRITPQTA